MLGKVAWLVITQQHWHFLKTICKVNAQSTSHPSTLVRVGVNNWYRLEVNYLEPAAMIGNASLNKVVLLRSYKSRILSFMSDATDLYQGQEFG